VAGLLDLFARLKLWLVEYRQSREAGAEDTSLQEAYKKLYMEFTNTKPSVFGCPECSAMWAELGPQQVPDAASIPALIDAARSKQS
jgi:hypothetical protein